MYFDEKGATFPLNTTIKYALINVGQVQNASSMPRDWPRFVNTVFSSEKIYSLRFVHMIFMIDCRLSETVLALLGLSD